MEILSNGIVSVSNVLLMNGNFIKNLANPVLSQDAATKRYVDTSYVDPSRLIGYPNDSSTLLTGNGLWTNVLTNTTSNTTFGLNNNNTTSTGTNFFLSKSGLVVSEFGFNNTTNEAYINVKNTASFKLITNNTSKIEINSAGMISILNTLVMNNNLIKNLANPVNSQDAATKNYTDTFTLTPSRITGYPSNSSLFLNGAGSWTAPTASVTLPLNLYASGVNDGIFIFNNNNSSYATSFGAINQNNNNSVYFGLNNSTNEAYVWSYGSALKIGVDSTLLAKFFSDNAINLFSYNWLWKSSVTKSSVQIFGLGGNALILENLNGESAGIGFDGSTDGCTIWTAGDTGSYLNIQDEDAPNSRYAYVATNGTWTVVSSAKRKHSIKEKSNNNVLDRFLKLSVKTYGYKYEENDEFSEKKKERIKRKTNKMSTGLILEELFEIFPNCIPDYYNELFHKKDVNKKLNLKKELKDVTNSGIDYNTLLCYFIIAFQEFVKKTNENISKIQNKE